MMASNDPHDPAQARRNRRTALWLALLALGFLAAFVWSTAQHH